MGKIRVLSDQVANKIAAGEVVERPASVVKELLENAVDAGATRLDLEVVAGGAQRIRLTDNGGGMTRDDALLALERHATSKLTDVASLSAIATLGFRGEALPSIASVSQFTLETAAVAGQGTRVRIEGGRLSGVDAVGLPVGTAVTVANLFANIPARRKFLKSEATEVGHITTLVTHYALAYPEIQFRLTTPHRELLALEPAATPGERLRQIFGEELAGQCLEFRATAQWAPDAEAAAAQVVGCGLYGFASRPELQKLNRNSIFVFVNRRLVRDRLLLHAITSAYHNLLPTNTFPAVLLFLDLPFAEVDVNVHPAKTEVRFRRADFIHDAARDAIRNALAENRPVPSFLQERERRATAALTWMPPSPLPFSPGADAALGISAADLPSGFQLTVAPPRPVEQRLPLEVPGAPSAVGRPSLAADPAPDWVPETGLGCGLRHYPAASGAGLADELAALRALGQIAESFIVASGPGGLWLVDQHCAHERVLFEQLLAARLEAAVESQRLLLPVVVELDPGRWLRFGEVAAELAAAGFEAEPFGRNTVAIQATPAGIAGEQAERLLREILELAADERGITLQRLRTRITATIACHAAIKVHMALEPDKMEWLLARLASVRYPMTCPHGRPVLLRYGLDEIQRAFKRTP
ncbi:MAG: DNA mismatch repair endonuclease MutL [Terriglobales bacterium]